MFNIKHGGSYPEIRSDGLLTLVYASNKPVPGICARGF